MRYTWHILAFAWLALSGCKEISPEVRFGPPTGLGDRVVLIEEFTGAQCTFCPPGSEQLADLLSLYPDNLAVVGLHVGFFATPHATYSKYDFRTPAGNALETFLGAAPQWPIAIVNRRQFPGDPSMHAVQAKWAGYIAEEVAKDPAVGLTMSSDFNPDTRLLSVTVRGLARQGVSSPLRMNIVITESDIIDYQKDVRFGDVLDYKHKHVLRGMMNATFAGGDLVAPNGLQQGQEVLYQAEMVIPDEWNPANCELIAFIANSDTKYVIQAAKKSMID
jgi:hypothetical protein